MEKIEACFNFGNTYSATQSIPRNVKWNGFTERVSKQSRIKIVALMHVLEILLA